MEISIIDAKGRIQKLIDKYHRIEESGQLKTFKEPKTKKDFIEPFFEALGWDVRNIETDDEVTPEENVSKGRVDYAFRINGIPKFFLEAKGIHEDLEETKHAIQAINYAYIKGVTWAVLCNFKGIKVFNSEMRTPDPIFSKFIDLTYEQYISDFDKLWLLSRESFKEGLIDKEAEKWGKKRKRIPIKETIDKQLLSDFTDFREMLSKDIVKNNRSRNLSQQDVDEAVQRILNRFIFIRKCEDNKIEPNRLESEIRIWEDRPKRSLYDNIKEIFRYFDKEYDSELFEFSLCDQLVIADHIIKGVILGLYKTRDGSIYYDFSAIDADVLGNIYEQYLGHILSKTEKRAKVEAKQIHRKEMGIYYTPTFIVDYIVRNTVGELLNKKFRVEDIKILDPACGSGSFLLKAFDVLNKYWFKKDTKKYSQTKFDLEEIKFDRGGISFSKKVEILKNNIFGVDLDQKAVEIAQLNLLLKTMERKHRLPMLKENIKCGNSLIDDESFAGDKAFKWGEKYTDIMNNGRFHVIIGNPPYVAWYRINRDERKIFETGKFIDLNFACRPNHKDSQPNYYLFFLVRAFNLLNKNGLLSFIIPQEWLHHNYAQDFRNYLLDKSGEIRIVQFNPIFKVFRSVSETVGTNSLIIIIDNRKTSKKLIHFYLDELDENKIKSILTNKSLFDTHCKKTIRPFSELYDNIWSFTETRKLKIKRRITSIQNLVAFGNKIHFEVAGGFQPPIDKAKLYEIGEIEYNQLSPEEKQLAFNLVYDANDINRYYLKSTLKKFWIIANEIKTEEELKLTYPKIHEILTSRIENRSGLWWHFPNIRNWDLIKDYPTKILSPRTAPRPSFALDEQRSVFKGTNTMIISKTFNPKFVLAVLNSKLSYFWYANFGYEYHGGKAKKYEPDKAKNFLMPIRNIPESEQKKFVEYVDEMLRLAKHLNEIINKETTEKKQLIEEIKDADKKIDELVYELYGITKEEQKIIEKELE